MNFSKPFTTVRISETPFWNYDLIKGNIETALGFFKKTGDKEALQFREKIPQEDINNLVEFLSNKVFEELGRIVFPKKISKKDHDIIDVNKGVGLSFVNVKKLKSKKKELSETTRIDLQRYDHLMKAIFKSMEQNPQAALSFIPVYISTILSLSFGSENVLHFLKLAGITSNERGFKQVAVAMIACSKTKRFDLLERWIKIFYTLFRPELKGRDLEKLEQKTLRYLLDSA